eukprot:COSAG01_NODE_1312_length_10767_cov_25.248969_2_plen_166_part_00
MRPSSSLSAEILTNLHDLCGGAAGMNGDDDEVFAMKVHFNLSDSVVPPPPPPPIPPAPTPLSPKLITIATVQYGVNCVANASHTDFGCDSGDSPPTTANCLAIVRNHCDSKPRCNVTVLTPSTDPCPFVEKHLSVTFHCGGLKSPLRNNTLEGEASGQSMFIGCG